MNIYIHVEISARELDSKLLLATLAASRGHQVIISDISGIVSGITKGLLAPGIFHTKSLTPTKKKIARHQAIVNKGFLITSIDEEAGLDIDGYEEFSKTRYSEKTMEQSSMVFAWGSDDEEALKQDYSKHSSKIIKTGSPRADLWKPRFSDYWGIPFLTPKKPFLLISSNMAWSNGMVPFHESFINFKRAGYYQREPELVDFHFGYTADNYLTTAAFIKAIQHLSEHNNGYDIVLRPHPAENIEIWKIFLDGIPNVHVIREDSISAWVNNAFAVMHNGCTTAFETIVSNKPLLTYVPYVQKYGNELPNKLGFHIQTPEELLKKVNTIFDDLKSDVKKNINKPIPELISKKIFFDGEELAAYKIVKKWDSLTSENLSQTSNWTKFQWFLKATNFKRTLSKVLKKLFPNRLGNYKENYKFPPLNKNDISKRISSLEQVLGIDEKLECKLLSERTILIKQP